MIDCPHSLAIDFCINAGLRQHTRYRGGSMRKIIATKRIKQWQKLDRLVFIVPFIIFLYLSFGKEGRMVWGIALKEQSFAVAAAAFFLLGLSTAISALPVMLIWRAVSHTVKNAAIQNATFRTDEDFDYYREKLTGIPPATISLLMDLQIEAKKDVTALILKYAKMGAISMEDGTIRVYSRELPDLTPSDRTLLELISQGQAQPANLGQWKRQAIAEAVESGNLKYRGARQNISLLSHSCCMGCLSGCLIPILLFIGVGLGAATLKKSGWMNTIEDLLAAAPQDFGTEQVSYLFSSPDMIIAVAVAALLVLMLFAMLWLPAAALLRTVLSASGAVVRLKRTEEGELLTAQISGLKNFIRDFSNLSEAEKEQLILWDDFLIYAVVLEENKRIIEDIFRMKNLRYRDFTLF